MANLLTVQTQVERILRRYPKAREDDEYLYYKICKDINPLTCGINFETVVLHRNEFGLPPLESVTRARRKLQADYPELRATEDKRRKRTKKEGEYINYALSEISK